MCVNFKDKILFNGGECENSDKFEIFHETVNCRYSTD